MKERVGWDQRAGTKRSLVASAGPPSYWTHTRSKNWWAGARYAILSHPTAYGAQAGCTRSRGTAMVMVLVGLAVVTSIFLSALKLIAVQRQSVELQTRQIQAGWLAESGAERAAARLAADADYRGETWNIPAQDLGGRDGASIAIRVDDFPGKPDRRTIYVEADYPDDPLLRAREGRELTVSLKGPKP